MKDHKSPKRTLEVQGVKPEDFYKLHRSTEGVRPEAVHGVVKKPNGVFEHEGAIPMGPGWSEDHFVPDHCVVPKADGSACKARPIRGRDFCIGHSRMLERMG